jgi:uncharacterized protein YfaS (alpha-2-macroglobulin family)
MLRFFHRHFPTLLSRYVYVELINPFNEVVSRHQIRPDSNLLFHNAIDLPEELPQGSYRLRAYTKYMENQGEDYFFSRPVYVYLPSLDNIKMEMDVLAADSKSSTVSLHFVNRKNDNLLFPERVSISLNGNDAKNYKPDKDGNINLKLPLPANDVNRTVFIEYKLLEDKKTYKFKTIFSQYAVIPFTVNNIDLSFYPEGGNIVYGKTNRIAFKALRPDGSPADVSGSIVDAFYLLTILNPLAKDSSL